MTPRFKPGDRLIYTPSGDAQELRYGSTLYTVTGYDSDNFLVLKPDTMPYPFLQTKTGDLTWASDEWFILATPLARLLYLKSNDSK